jgi:hypothetical protein
MFSPSENNLKQIKSLEFPKSFAAFLQKYRYEFAEKIILVGLISFIFAQIFPNLRATNMQVVVGVTVVILANALFSYIIMRSPKLNISILDRFFPMLVLNTFVALVYVRILSGSESSTSFLTVLFFAYIVTLLTVLYDRFRPYYLQRFSK